MAHASSSEADLLRPSVWNDSQKWLSAAVVLVVAAVVVVVVVAEVVVAVAAVVIAVVLCKAPCLKNQSGS